MYSYDPKIYYCSLTSKNSNKIAFRAQPNSSIFYKRPQCLAYCYISLNRFSFIFKTLKHKVAIYR